MQQLPRCSSKGKWNYDLADGMVSAVTEMVPSLHWQLRVFTITAVLVAPVVLALVEAAVLIGRAVETAAVMLGQESETVKE